MGRLIGALYGALSYVAFLASFVYAIGFVAGVGVPKTIDSGPSGDPLEAVVVDCLLLGVFAVQHSVMARAFFKNWLMRFLPAAVERSTYVLSASAALALICWQWQPIGGTAWEIPDPALAGLVQAIAWMGWLIVLVSTFLISHFELFGLAQVWGHVSGREAAPAKFVTPMFYRYVRHPIYFGFVLAIWGAPVMSLGHLLFAIGVTGYILIGIQFEERDLIRMFGDSYRAYRRRVSMLIPLPPGRTER